ncbi:MAG: hypothetical protein HY736_23150 [Verrucomicrobia bacterium]|nr:hypothetical protein [Verrucomicrobiota bacterium]
MQVPIRFPDKETEQKALGKLIPRFVGKSWSSGETMVPAPALAFLAAEGVSFTVIGPARYGRITSIRDSRVVAF